jgi:hypothetical protein
MSFITKVTDVFRHPKHLPYPLKHEQIQKFLNETPKIVRASIVETYGREVMCEVEDEEGTLTHLGSGANSVGIWMHVISERDGVEIPEGLRRNE